MKRKLFCTGCTDIPTDRGDTICSPHPLIENGRGIKTALSRAIGPYKDPDVCINNTNKLDVEETSEQ